MMNINMRKKRGKKAFIAPFQDPTSKFPFNKYTKKKFLNKYLGFRIPLKGCTLYRLNSIFKLQNLHIFFFLNSNINLRGTAIMYSWNKADTVNTVIIDKALENPADSIGLYICLTHHLEILLAQRILLIEWACIYA